MTIKKSKIDYEMYSLLLNDRQFRLNSMEGVTSRALTHWRKLGHLEDNSKNFVSGKASYFSAVELVWISIISDLREMQIDHSKIEGVKFGLFAPIKAGNGKEYPALEYYMIEVFEMNVAVYIILTNANELLILNDLVYHDKLKSGEIENHTAVLLNKQIRDTLKDIFAVPNSSEFTGLSIEEIQVLHIIRNKTYKYINITKKDGEIARLEGTEQILEASRIADLLKKGQYQNLEIKQHNGKIVCVNRTIRKKIAK